MSKTKDKAIDEQNATVSDGSPIGIAELLKNTEGVEVTDETRLRVKAEDKETLSKRLDDAKAALEANYTVIVSPTYGDAAAIGCVWYDIIVEPKLS